MQNAITVIEEYTLPSRWNLMREPAECRNEKPVNELIPVKPDMFRADVDFIIREENKSVFAAAASAT